MSKVCLFYQHYHSCPNQTHTIYVWANPDCPFHAYPPIFASLSRLFLLPFPVYRASFPRLQRLISPTIGFLLHFPDYSVSLYTHSKDKRDFKISCLLFLDYIDGYEERNRIRAKITQCFESINVHGLPMLSIPDGEESGF